MTRATSGRLSARFATAIVAVVAIWGCILPLGCAAAATRAATAPGPTVPPRCTIEQAISDKAQSTTLAFDALGFITGSLGSDSFFPPGKVADFWGFQYLRDNDPSEMGHNTDFLTSAALNMYTVLTPQQRQQLATLATSQVALINDYGYRRFVLMKAFRRQLADDIPTGTTGLSEDAVKAYSAELYRLDGEISYERAQVMGPILASLSSTQTAYLDAMVGKGMAQWPKVAEPDDMKPLSHDEKVAVMTYAGDMFSWYAGDVEADVYFCPERHGTYFGSFYLKDAPAVGNPGYSIPTTMTAEMGDNFIRALDPQQAALINGLVDAQRADLLGIVDVRRAVATQLRQFRTGGTPDKTVVLDLMNQYGELDGANVYKYASAFCSVGRSLTDSQKTLFADYRHQMLGDFSPTGAFLYATPIDTPEIADTDFLFVGATAADAVTGFSATTGHAAATLSWTNPASAFETVRVLRSATSFAASATVTGEQVLAYEGTGASHVETGLTNGTTYRFTAFVRNTAGQWSVAATATATPLSASYIGTPVLPSTMYHYRTYLVYGSLKPRHAAGTIVGALQCDRYYSGAWHRTRTYTVRASNFYGYSRYKSYIVSLPTAGRWRVRAYHSATSSSEAGYSSWYYVTVR